MVYSYLILLTNIIEGSLEVKLPTIWTDEKQSRAEAERREKIRREKSRRERVRRKKMQMREKVGKSRNTVFFQWFEAPEGRKVGSLKRRVRSQPDERWKIARRSGAKHISKSKCTKHTILGALLEVEMSNKCTPLWREAHFEVKMYKAHQRRTTLGSCDVEKVHAVVARSTFPSQNVQNTPCSDHFWKLRCRKSARRCGAKHFWKLRCRKSARRCGAKHILKSKVQKTEGYGALLDVQMLLRVAGTRDCAPCQEWAKREGFGIFNYNHHYTTLHSNTLRSNTLHSITLNYTQLHYTTLRYTTLHYTTLQYTTLRYLPLHYITLHYTTLHYTTLPSTTLHCTTLHSATLHYITLHHTTLPSTTLHYITLHYAPQHYNYNYTTTLHYTPLH